MGIESFPLDPDLPDEIILRILHLYAGEWNHYEIRTVAALRVICKRWKPIVEEVLVRHLRFWHMISAKEFTKWSHNRGTQSLVKTCTLHPSRSESMVQLKRYTTLLTDLPNLRKLTVHHLYPRAVVQLASHVPYLQELSLLEPGICVPRPPFHRIFPFISKLKFLKSLSLDRIDFYEGEDDEPLTIGLACICLRDCYDSDNLVSSVFSLSRSTLRRYTFTSASEDMRYRDLMPLPSFIDDESCLNDLTLTNYAHDSRRPASIPGVTTLCILGSRLVAVSQLESAKALFSRFFRVIITNLDFAAGFELASQALWSKTKLRWLEVEASCFRNRLGFERAVLPWGRFVRVLSIYRVWSVPHDFSIFPQLQALQLSDVSLNEQGKSADFQPGWLVPTLRVLSIAEGILTRKDLCVIMAGLLNRSPGLCCIVGGQIGRFGDNKIVDQFRKFCYARDVELTPAINRFHDWARHFALNLT